MDTPEYVQIIRRHLAASRAAAHAGATTTAPLSTIVADEGSDQSDQSAQIAPAQAGSGPAPLEAGQQIVNKLPTNPPAPPADVAAGPVAPASLPAGVGKGPVAPASLPAGVGKGPVAPASLPAGVGKGVPATWQELDPRAYQPRPFGPMETDPDWPGEPDEEEDAPGPPATVPAARSLVAPATVPVDPPAARLPTTEGPAGAEAGATSTEAGAEAAAIDLASTLIRQVDRRGGLAIPPPAGDPFPDLEDVCWLCEDEVEFYDPSGQAWCSLCIAEAGKTMGWQDLIDLLPASWQRHAESNRQLAAYAAAHYHQAGRRRIALRWSQPPFHQTLQGADLFRAFARWLAAPERWKQREAERQLERLVEHQGLGA